MRSSIKIALGITFFLVSIFCSTKTKAQTYPYNNFCSGSTNDISTALGVSGRTFKWTLGSVSSTVTGAVSNATLSATINQKLTLSGTGTGTVNYNVTDDLGTKYTIVVSVLPIPTISNTATWNSVSVGCGNNINFSAASNIAVNTDGWTWSRATILGTNEISGTSNLINDNLINSISSSSALDQQEVYIEGHTVSGVGVNQKFTFVTQVVTLNGQNRVALTTPLARVSQAYNNDGISLIGRICVYENTAITAGVPNDATKIHIDIEQGLQQAFKAATTFSDTDYYILTGGFGSVSVKQSGAADFYLEIKEAGKVFRQVAAVSASSGSPWEIDLDPAVIIPRNCDVRVRVETASNNVVVFTVFKGYLAKVL